MKRLLLFVILSLTLSVQAQKKISEYPNTATAYGADLFILARPSTSTNYNIQYQQLTTQLQTNSPLHVTGTFGANIVTNGDFATDINGWTGINWAWLAGTAKHTAGSTDPISQAAAIPTRLATYKVVFTISGRTAGNVSAYIGGAWGEVCALDGTYTTYLTALNTDPFAIAPETSFNGAIDDVSVQPVSSGTLEVDNTASFYGPIKLYGNIDVAQGRSISIGYGALPASSATGDPFNTKSANIAIGYMAGATNRSTGHVTVIGYFAGSKNSNGVITVMGKLAGRDNISGHITAVGNSALKSNTTGYSTAFGDEAASANTTGYITAVGHYAAVGNTIGDGTTAIGYYAAQNNTTGRVTAVGHQAAWLSTIVNGVTAVGWSAGLSNTTGRITAIGDSALYQNTTANAVAVGYRAGYYNTTGEVTIVGYAAGDANTTGNSTLVGHLAGYGNTTGNLIAIGHSAAYGATPGNKPSTDIDGILIGESANRSVATTTQLTNYVGIGARVLIDKSNQIKLGNTSTTEILFSGNVGLGTLGPTNKLEVNGMTYHTNVTASAGDPVNGILQWSSDGQAQYRTSAANEGAGQINRIHNRATQVVGVGTDYSLTQTATNVTFGTSGGSIALPTAGTYTLHCLANFTSTTAADDLHFYLWDSTNNVVIPGSWQHHESHANNDHDVTPLTAVYTVTTNVHIWLGAVNVTAARGVIVSTNTILTYVRCY